MQIFKGKLPISVYFLQILGAHAGIYAKFVEKMYSEPFVNQFL